MNKKYLSILITTQILTFTVISLLIVFLSGNISSHNNEILRMVTMKNTEECMREIVDNTIIRIEQKRELARFEVQSSMNLTSTLLQDITKESLDLKAGEILDQLHQTEYGAPINMVVQYEYGKVLLYSNEEVSDITTNFANYKSKNINNTSTIYAKINLEFGYIYLFAEQIDIDKIAKDYIYQEIHQSDYTDNEYIWVNEITNYEGGDNYAIRIIHPNLKDTEGQLLSTNMTDASGELPYLKELNGINEKGEIVHTYCFTNKVDGNITPKMSYAKLYEPFNWIIATGEPIDDIFTYTNKLKEYDSKAINTAVIICLNLMIIIFLIGVIIILKIHKGYKKKLDAYVKIETKLDSLTGAHSRKSGEEILLEEFNRFSQNKNASPLFIMVDIDNFRSINDTYGHNVGDLVLKKVIQSITSNIRENDYVFRWGGEEFIILCKRVDPKNHYQIGEKILRCVNGIVFENNDHSFNVSVSIGSSYLNLGDEGYDVALKRADEALYYSKNTGKNKYSYYPDLSKEVCNEL